MQGKELSSPTRLAKDSGNSIAINVKTSNGWNLTCLAKPVECTYSRYLECIKTLRVDNEAGKWDATVLLSGTYRYYYLQIDWAKSLNPSGQQGHMAAHELTSPRAVQFWLGKKLQENCIRARWLKSWTPY